MIRLLLSLLLLLLLLLELDLLELLVGFTRCLAEKIVKLITWKNPYHPQTHLKMHRFQKI